MNPPACDCGRRPHAAHCAVEIARVKATKNLEIDQLHANARKTAQGIVDSAPAAIAALRGAQQRFEERMRKVERLERIAKVLGVLVILAVIAALVIFS